MQSPLTPAADEVAGLRAAMRDVQVTARAFHDASTGFVSADHLASPAKNAVGAIQVVNDLLTNEFSQRTPYASFFEHPTDGAETVLGFRYLRNVIQHLIHPVVPVRNSAVGGLGLGYRTFSTWSEVPASVDLKLRPRTRELRPHFERRLQGHEVMGSLLDASAFFASAVPELVHRASDDEWTGFPLRSQPGVRDRLHPEEPADETSAASWLDARRPGGDRRVLCGGLLDVDSVLLFGMTFRGSCVMTPFFETPAQVDADIALGYRYYDAPVAEHVHLIRLDDRCDAFNNTYCSPTDIASWTETPLAKAPTAPFESRFAEVAWWRDLSRLERPPNLQWYITRRERRLCAWYPIP